MERGPGARGLDGRPALWWVRVGNCGGSRSPRQSLSFSAETSQDFGSEGAWRLGAGARREGSWCPGMDEYGLDVGPERGLQDGAGAGPGPREGLYAVGEAAWGALGGLAQLGRWACV